MQDQDASAGPLVTALMPLKAYDPGYLSEALNSIRDQTSCTWRLVVIADPPDVRDVARALGSRLADERLDLVANEGTRLAGAINSGMRHAGTEFVALLFADDQWSLDAVAVLTRHIHESPHVDFFHSARRIIDDEGRPISGVHRPFPHVTLRDFSERNPVKHLLCWRRSMGLAIGGLDERSPSVGPDDMDFPWTMAEHGARFGAIDDCLYLYRDHRRVFRLTTHLPRRVHTREHRRVFRKHGLPRRQVRERVDAARRSFLQQCLFESRLEALVRTSVGRIPTPWRDTYR